MGNGRAPQCPIVVSILAAAGASDGTGEEALAAYVAGFKTESYLAAPISPGHYERGWHTTATFGVFGAVAGAATVLGLSARETRQALNVAASMPAGLKRNFGTMTKPMHVGQAVRSGLTAARLAANGFTANERAIEGDRGFLDLYGGVKGSEYRPFPELGRWWALKEDGVHVKKYPSCYFTQTSIEATVNIVTENDTSPADIAGIDVVASQGVLDAPPYRDPQSPLKAKFSMPYTVAYAVTNQQVGLAAFEDDAIDDPELGVLLKDVTVTTNDELEYDDHTATVCLEAAGEEYIRTVHDPPGSHKNPLSDRELHDKFRMCATRTFDAGRVAEVLDWLDDLRSEESLASLMAALT